MPVVLSVLLLCLKENRSWPVVFRGRHATPVIGVLLTSTSSGGFSCRLDRPLLNSQSNFLDGDLAEWIQRCDIGLANRCHAFSLFAVWFKVRVFFFFSRLSFLFVSICHVLS